MKSLFLFLACIISTSLLAQETTREITSFKYLKVSRGIEATLVKSKSKEVIINVRGLDPEDVLVINKNDELTIKVSTNYIWQEKDVNHWSVKVEIPFQELSGIEASTGASITSKDLIVSDDLEIEVYVGANLELRVDTNILYAEASMGGEIELQGRADILDVRSSMGSDVDLQYLSAMEVKAKSVMGGTIRVTATEEFNGNVSMGGDIVVYGNPEKFSKSTSMGGSIRSRSN